MLKVLDARVVSVKYKMRRRGSALLIVVVLVLMLAMMGTAFIMTVRISRDQITGTGSSLVVLPAGDYWPAVATGQLDVGEAEIEGAIVREVGESVRTLAGAYREPAGTTADFVVHPNVTQFLAARTPFLRDPAPANITQTRWAGVTYFPPRPPFVGYAFTTPYNPTGAYPAPLVGPTGVAYTWPPNTRTNLFISSAYITYPSPFNAVPTLSGRTRVFPTLIPSLLTGLPDVANAVMAGDADGDGIADAALFPLAMGSDTILLKDGVDHRVSYWGAVRIVDNAGAVNLNTAWRSSYDRDAAGTDITATYTAPTDPVGMTPHLHAYLGAFRPNIGLYELLRGVDVAKSRIVPDASVDSDFLSASGLDISRMGQASASAEMLPDPGATSPIRADSRFISQGDALQHQLVRRLDVPGHNYVPANPPLPYNTVTADLSDIHYRFTLLNPKLGNTAYRGLLNWTAFHLSPNYANDSRKRFSFYGANQFDFWYHSIFNTDSTPAPATDGLVGSRTTFFGTAGLANNPETWVEAQVRKTARFNLVEANPISTAVADPVAAFAALPAEIKDPAPGSPNPNLMPDDPAAETPVKADVNVANFGRLWRAYWSIFASQATVPTQARSAAFDDANITSGRRGTAWNPVNQQIVRAALAAVNTLTARNPELASGTFTIPLGREDEARAESRTFTLGAHDVTVYGVRKQPFITEVLIQRDETGVKYVAVELYNPYPTPLAIPGHSLAALNGNTLGAPVPVAATVAIPAGEYLTVYDGDAGANPVSITGTSVAAPGLLAMIVPGNDVVLLRTRRDDGIPSDNVSAGDNDDTYNEANVHDLIPIDQFVVRDNPANTLPLPPAAGTVDRFHYVRSDVTTGTFKAVWAGNLEFYQSVPPSLDAGTLGDPNTNTASVGMQADIVIPLANTFSDLLHPLRAGTAADPNRFPYGAFARDGDIASVPFIGHYRISDADHTIIYELNSVAVDATFADDGAANVGNDANEAVGRFIPIRAMGDAGAETYEFAHRLFDYVTATDASNDDNAPQEVATPQVEKIRYDDAGNAAIPPVEVEANAAGALNAGSQGRVNINTASWQVLAALPLVPVNPADPNADTPAEAAAKTEEVAKAIVVDRETNNEFHSIYDLNRVAAFMQASGDPAASDFTVDQGDLSPTDGVTNDYEQRIQAMTRISNLITARSDSFTAYVLVQGWIDANTPTPVMAAERRYILQIDRSKVTKDIPMGGADVTDILNPVP